MSNFQTALVQLPLVRESSGERVRTPEDVYRVCGDIANLAQEAFTVLALDVKNRLINRHLVSLGLADASLVHPREVFRAAIGEDGGACCALLLTHNHPSGDPTPSAEDLRITRQLIQAGRIIDIKVMDHVVIGRPRNGSPAFVSMREGGLCAFD
jgi:DNA repair protein RadC